MRKKIVTCKIACFLLVIVVVISCVGKNEKPKIMENMKQEKEALSVIFGRKSVRKYVEGKPISEEDLQTLLKAGMSAPSGKDTRPWEFVVVDDHSILEAMAAELPYAKMLPKASLSIVVCGDSAKSSYWYLDCSAAAQNILLAAEALGLGAVWTAAYPYEERMNVVAKNTGLPANICPLAVIPVGYPDGDFKPKDKYDAAKIHRNKWE
ncbi:MAG: nitroreductase family protein [Prolixibacteraceae bacterium]|nr:nitroreductase family protein [Prolixibacteraceae bacterium]